MGAVDAQGIWQYTEDDPASPFSDTLNLLAETTSDAVAADRARLLALESVGVGQIWTPSITGLTIGTGGLLSGYYARIADLVIWQWKFVFGTGSGVTGSLICPAPVDVRGGQWLAPAHGYVSRGTSTTAGNRWLLTARMTGVSTYNLWMDNGGASLGATSPLAGGTWASGDVIAMSGAHVAA